ncbi:MAG: type 4a pilus biogenesis protein PilO [candidate division NC10 bacterium]|nr:type 4a pilus biogenesis protein PilO [candidate division NC10 bacterium]
MTIRLPRLSWRWVVMLSLVLANALLLLLLLLPAWEQRTELEAQVRDLEQSMRGLQRETRSSETQLSAFREVEEFSQGYPRRADLVGLMGRLTKLARSLSLQVPDVNYSPSEMKEASLTKLVVTMGVEGTYGKIRRYLYELEGMRRFLVIERLSLRDSKGTSDVQVQLQLALYLR